jgi:hypothetical protein
MVFNQVVMVLCALDLPGAKDTATILHFYKMIPSRLDKQPSPSQRETHLDEDFQTEDDD